MPELPEVETVKRGLESLIVGKTIRSVRHDWVKSFPNSIVDVDAFLIGASVTGVRRRAKVLLVDLSTSYTLVIHLKMTGQLVFVPTAQTGQKLKVKSKKWVATQPDNFQPLTFNHSLPAREIRFGAGHPNESLVGKLPDKSTRVIFVFNDGSHLYFNDQRKFGWVKLIESQLVTKLEFFKKVGPEPLEPAFTFSVFKAQVMRRKHSAIKAVLLDQTILAGVGNIYADESLWGAKIHPETRVIDIPDRKLKKLHQEIIYVLTLSIEKGGSTDKNYVDAEGKRGSYLQFAKVFRRENLPCPRCGTTIEKIRVAGRGTHVCTFCQTKGSTMHETRNSKNHNILKN
jgi:formamidopyrimidine-DNA glycosylase